MVFASRTGPRSAARGAAALVWVAGVAALAAMAALAGFVPVPWSAPVVDTTLEGALVRRGPLPIRVIAAGSLNPAETISLASGVEGRTTILDIVPEGSRVSKGDIVCELDATPLEQERIQQAIELDNAQAALVKARQALQIQHSQNKSDVAKAEQAVAFAEQDALMFVEGERDSELETARQELDLAREETQRARDQLEWSVKLAERGFMTSTELEADRIAERRATVSMQQAERTLDLLERYRMPRRAAELDAALEEARRESERVALQAAARLVDFEAAVRSGTSIEAFEKEKLARLEEQIDKARLRAPRDGFVVYARRDNDEPPIQAGAEVREREEILSIPSSDGMLAEVKLHESVLQKVEVGQSCRLTVDALHGVVIEGRVGSVAMLPDTQSRWMNPNLRVYNCEVAILGEDTRLRPGMSCSVEILIEQIDDAVHVPVQAVFREGERTFAWVATRGGRERRDVVTGSFNDLWVQILEGLEEGETVLLREPAGASSKSPPRPEKAGDANGTAKQR
jgi:HlyD family secretion protein